MLKAGVDLRGIKPQMAVAYTIASHIYRARGYWCTITSASDGKHGPNSLHYSGNALDLRTRDCKPDDLQMIYVSLRQALGAQFDVVLEKDHIHVEFDPKEPDVNREDV